MNKFKELTRPILSLIFGIAFVVFTAMKIIPPEAFVGVVGLNTTGWSGKISGVTNPAKIMGVAKINIAKVKGVA